MVTSHSECNTYRYSTFVYTHTHDFYTRVALVTADTVIIAAIRRGTIVILFTITNYSDDFGSLWRTAAKEATSGNLQKNFRQICFKFYL